MKSLHDIASDVVMKIASFIQAADTGRLLFVKEMDQGVFQNRWIPPGTQYYYNWLSQKGIEGVRKEISRYIIMDPNETLHWFNAKNDVGIILIRLACEQRVYAPPGEWVWHSLFDLPVHIHPYTDTAMSDLIFLDTLVTGNL